MAKKEQASYDDSAMVTALATHRTMQQAADACGVSLTTIRRRLKNPAFCRKLAAMRARLSEHTATFLSEHMTNAAGVLHDLTAEGINNNTRRAAARDIIELGQSMRNDLDVERRLRELETKFAAHSEGRKIDDEE